MEGLGDGVDTSGLSASRAQPATQDPIRTFRGCSCILSTKVRAAGGQEGSLALGRERGMGRGVESWLFSLVRNLSNDAGFPGTSRQGSGRSVREERGHFKPYQGCWDIIFCKW